jgi:two-component system sensor histidine kinase ChvG
MKPLLRSRTPLLPDVPATRLFDSMVSLCDAQAGAANTQLTVEEPNLRLGLFVVRVIAEFHGGHATAHNRQDGSGVVMALHLLTRASA